VVGDVPAVVKVEDKTPELAPLTTSKSEAA